MAGQLTLQWRTEGAQVVLHVIGEVDAEASRNLAGVAIVAEVGRDLVVDLSQVSFVDIAGLRLLEDLARRGGVRFRAPSAAVRRLLDALGSRHALPLT